MTGVRRWPVHPVPGPVEALSSWMERCAGCFGLTVDDLLRYDLDPVADPMSVDREKGGLDWNPPVAVLVAMERRTGVKRHQLRTMTIAGWVPWLLDGLDIDGQPAFDHYVREHSVLFRPGAAGRNRLREVRGGTRPWRPWLSTRIGYRPLRRVCPRCAEVGRGIDLLADLPIMTSCVEHGLRLLPERDVSIAAVIGKPLAIEPAPGPVIELDRYTHQGLTTGTVALPGRTIHVGVWFRLLRTLLHEVSVAPARVGVRSAAALRRIWQATDGPARAGLSVWQPYEQLDWDRQQAMLHAAAVAVNLIANGEITACGTLGPVLARPTHQEVYDGDEPPRSTQILKEIQREIDAMIETARSDPDVARNVLTTFTSFCRSVDAFNREREFLIGLGIPATFLPSFDDLGRNYPASALPGPVNPVG